MSFKVIKEDDKTCEVYAYTETTGNKTIIHQAVDKDYSGDITIPSVVNGYSVIGLSDYAFSYTNISLINISTGVMYIGNKAFEGCTFQSITLPEGLKSIGSNAFMSCKKLESINIPQSVETIGFGAFVYCSNMEMINLPSGNLKKMGGGVFQGCKKLKKLEIPEGVASIGEKDSGTSFIWDCKELESITLPSTLLYINEELLGQCPSLSKIVVKMTDTTAINIESYSLTWAYDSPSIYETARLYVPVGSKAAYQVADYWKDFNEIIEFLPIISFADANVKTICVANWDTDGDGELSEGEAAAVTDLGQVFKNNTQITSFEELHFFTGLTSIGTEAFYGCTNLSTVTMPNSITSIGNLAFWSCRKITSISIPNSVTVIEDYAFNRCSGLTSIAIPESVTSIGKGAFLSCDNLASFNIPNSVTYIGYAAFGFTAWYDNQPDGLLYIGDFLYGYKGVMSENSIIEIKEGTKRIVDMAFYECNNISSISIPNGIIGIGEKAFEGCSGISSIIIPNSVSSIGKGAFQSCTNLTSVDISNSLTTIDDFTFGLCSKLTSVTIPDGVTKIGTKAFSGTNLATLTIPNNVTAIGYCAFEYCNSLISLDIPSSVTIIDKEAFIGCSKLASVIIGNGVSTIGDYAFAQCNELKSVTMENKSPISISSSTFSNRANATLYVPSGAKTAYQAADYWKEFKKIIEPSPVISFVDANVKAICVANWDTDGDGELSEAEAAAVTSLKGAFQWNQNISSFDELRYFTSLTEIEERAFIMTGLKSITLPNTIKSIGNFSFEGCTQLSSIVFSENLEAIGWSAFHNCKSLENISLPYSVKDVYGSAFNGCSGLKKLDLPGSLVSIGEMAFADCTSLESVIITSFLTNIESDSFYGCDGLTSIRVEEGNPAFDSRDNCNAVIRTQDDELVIACKTTVIPNTVKVIGKNAFGGLKELREITLPASIEHIGAVAFYGCDNLQEVISQMSIPCTVDETAFLTNYSEDNGYTFTTATLHVPEGCVTNYKESDMWKEFGTILEHGTILTENDIIFSDDTNIYIGYSSNLAINLSNENSFTAYQFDLQLPEGITLTKDESGKYIVSKSDRYSDNSQQVKIEDIGDNTYRFVSVSLQNGVINGNDGTILMASIKASEDIAEGTPDASIKNIILTMTDETKMKPKDTSFSIMTSSLKKGDADGDGEIDVTDVVSMINCVMGKPSENFNSLAADLNDDGEVDIFDIMQAINLVMSQKASARLMTRALTGNVEQAYITSTGNSIMLGINNPTKFTAFQFDVEVTESKIEAEPNNLSKGVYIINNKKVGIK